MIEWRPLERIRAQRAKPPRRCKPLPPSPLAGAGCGITLPSAAGNGPNGEEPTTMDDLDPAAGAMPAMPMGGRQSFAQRSGGRPRGRPKGSRNKATLALEAVLEGSAE